MYSYNIPGTTTGHKEGDICFCSNSGSNILLWQFDFATTSWKPIYKYVQQ
jgi:hypothetical protein